MKRTSFLDQLLKGDESLCLENLKPNLSALLNELDGIFYTLEFLEREKLISIIKNNRTVRVDLFNGFSEFDAEKEDHVIFGQIFYYDKLGKEGYAMSWQIKMEPGLLVFKKNGYRTLEQIRSRRSFWLAIGVGVGSAAVTAILSALLTKTPILNCF